MIRRKSARVSLVWSRCPSRALHPVLGARLRWWERERGYRIDRFLAATGRFIACRVIAHVPQVIGDYPSLQAAKRACQALANEHRRM
jgi:hypothetical protein